MSISTAIARAKDTAVKYNPEGLIPFPFQEMSDQLGNVELVFLKPSNEGISGAVLFQDDKFTIIVNNTKPETRQYFTVAHEFGHYFLHNDWLRSNNVKGVLDYSEQLDVQNMLLRADQPHEATVDPQKEREANNFAAELLMPADKVREFWELTRDIAECAEAFRVSKSAMAVRLERLQLIS